MDAIYIFPALLALMIAALTALGYALQRIGDASFRLSGSPTSGRLCPQCGLRFNAGAKRCPACGTSLEVESMLVDITPHNQDNVSTSAPRKS